LKTFLWMKWFVSLWNLTNIECTYQLRKDNLLNSWKCGILIRQIDNVYDLVVLEVDITQIQSEVWRDHHKVQDLWIVNEYRVVIVISWVATLIYNLSHHYNVHNHCKELALISINLCDFYTLIASAEKTQIMH